jgi:hypothetical protein
VMLGTAAYCAGRLAVAWRLPVPYPAGFVPGNGARQGRLGRCGMLGGAPGHRLAR